MLFTTAAAALLAAAPTTVANEPAPPPVVVTKAAPASADEAKNKKDNFDLATMMAIFDKIFPAQPDPAPERLALAQTSVGGLLPNGAYGRMMESMMGGVVDRVLNLSEADLGIKGKKGKPASTETLRQSLIKDDPAFDERMNIIRSIVGEEMAKMSSILEPRIREGLARSMARRFDEKQLADLNAFLATDSGRAFGQQSIAMWVDPDVMRSVMGGMPEMIMAMPAALKRIETETAHLPKPKKKKGEESK